jgi:hypothetical protein
MLKHLVENLNLVLTFVFACLIEIGLAVCAFFVGDSSTDRIITFSCLAVSFAVGSIIGTIVSPYDQEETKRFASYGKAVLAFFTGYVASKLEPVITTALKPDILASPSSLTSFRVLACAATVLLVAKVTFACRSYH